LAAGTSTTFDVSNTPAFSISVLVVGLARYDTSLAPYGFPGLSLVPAVSPLPGALGTLVLFGNASGNASLTWSNFPAGFSGVPFYWQALAFDSSTPNGLAATNAIYRRAQ
ncbi:MAG: hypothetical protein KDC98_15405, partial [Planctomycetes bacterium]|nr:hypothetical protein [Planctomycetota bacterium]